MAALETLFAIKGHRGIICSDNKGALYKLRESRRRIPVGASQADIKRALRSVKDKLSAKFTYKWVESHQDRYKLWCQLLLKQQLNCLCDTLAKNAVQLSMSPTAPRNMDPRLPHKHATVFIRSVN